MSDKSGFRPIYTMCEEMVAASLETMKKAAAVQHSSRSAKPPTSYRRVKEAITKNNGTVTVGFAAEGAAWLAGAMSIGLSFDYKGNIALQFTGSIGDGSPNISCGIFSAATNAPDVTKLNGLGHSIGGSGGDGVCFGGDFLIIPNSQGGYYHGTSLNAGVGVKMPLPGEVHYLPGYTVSLYKINVFDMLESLVN